MKPELLSRYLPPIQDEIASTWLRENIPQGSWILDPFCASPRLAVEAARSGYKILVAANNPIARFLLEILANPPKKEDLKSTLAELAASYKGTERIEPHIRSLYNTLCARCGQVVSADAFIWEHGNTAPYLRIYNCPYCGDAGEHPCTAYDTEQTRQFSSSGLHKARALERVVAAGDQDRIHVEQALSVYLPRALYALITLINKVEGLDISPNNKKYLSALLLYAFDQANVMWRIPVSRERRRQLYVPRHFRENNIWHSLEQAVELWSDEESFAHTPEVSFSTWPDLPSGDGGICLFEGRFASIADSLTRLNIMGVCTAIPRPNQAYWTLSALWSGWLWGREAVKSFKSVLHRQRYDWGWHTSALTTLFTQLANVLQPSTPVYGLLGEVEPGFISSALVAAAIAGLNLQGIAIRLEEAHAQILWKSERAANLFENQRSLVELAIEGSRKYLENRGEPERYINTIIAAVVYIVNSHIENNKNGYKQNELADSVPTPEDRSEKSDLSSSSVYSTIYNSARESLTYRSGFLHLNLQDIESVETSPKAGDFKDTLFSTDTGKMSPEDDELSDTSVPPQEQEISLEKERPTRSSDISESILVWLRDPGGANIASLTEKCELSIYDYFINNQECSEKDINWIICKKYRGLYTPDLEYIRMCLDSYCENDQLDESLWHLRAEDFPNTRRIDISNVIKYIHQIGGRLGLRIIDALSTDTPNVTWADEQNENLYQFYVLATANINNLVLTQGKNAGKNYIVLPGSRANLVLYKLRRDPRLYKAFHPATGSWQFIKFRHMRSLSENPLLQRENLDQLLQLDPLTFSTPQLRLI